MVMAPRRSAWPSARVSSARTIRPERFCICAVPREAQDGADAGCRPEQPDLRTSVEAWRVLERHSPRMPTSAFRLRHAGRVIGAGAAMGWSGGGYGRHAGLWRIARIVASFGGQPFLRLETLYRCPGPSPRCHRRGRDRPDSCVSTSRCARIAAMTQRYTSVISSRPRFFVNTVGTRTALSTPGP